MQAKPLDLLKLPAGSQILDAGCGYGRVALYMAQHGMRITAVDVLHRHVQGAKQACARTQLPKGQLEVLQMDYHNLEAIPSNSHDGVFTVQASGHAMDLDAAIADFYRALKPGGRIALIEAERRRQHPGKRSGDALSKNLKLVNEYVGYPNNKRSKENFYQEALEKAGFVDVQVEDYTENIQPMLRMGFWMMLVPFIVISLLGLQQYFPTMYAMHYGYWGRDEWRHIGISACKPALRGKGGT